MTLRVTKPCMDQAVAPPTQITHCCISSRVGGDLQSHPVRASTLLISCWMTGPCWNINGVDAIMGRDLQSTPSLWLRCTVVSLPLRAAWRTPAAHPLLLGLRTGPDPAHNSHLIAHGSMFGVMLQHLVGTHRQCHLPMCICRHVRCAVAELSRQGRLGDSRETV